jgi:hypothetical protein
MFKSGWRTMPLSVACCTLDVIGLFIFVSFLKSR